MCDLVDQSHLQKGDITCDPGGGAVCKATAEAESKENHGVRDPKPELTMSTPAESTPTHYHGQPYAIVDFIPQSGTLDLASGCLRWIHESLTAKKLTFHLKGKTFPKCRTTMSN